MSGEDRRSARPTDEPPGGLSRAASAHSEVSAGQARPARSGGQREARPVARATGRAETSQPELNQRRSAGRVRPVARAAGRARGARRASGAEGAEGARRASGAEGAGRVSGAEGAGGARRASGAEGAGGARRASGAEGAKEPGGPAELKEPGGPAELKEPGGPAELKEPEEPGGPAKLKEPEEPGGPAEPEEPEEDPGWDEWPPDGNNRPLPSHKDRPRRHGTENPAEGDAATALLEEEAREKCEPVATSKNY